VRRLSIDPGAKRVGLAWSDGETSIALPHKTLSATNRGALLSALLAEIADLAVAEVIVGLPLQLDGTEGEAARRSRLLATQLEKATSARVVLWDERLTTVSAERALREAGIKARDQRGKVDRAAATILLQSYLDAHTETPWDEDPVLPPDAPPVRVDSRRKKGAGRRG
jgi:putative Holliday junction resolvase